jgi:hypothetical protein
MKISILLITAFAGLALAKDEKHCRECEKRYNTCMKLSFLPSLVAQDTYIAL